MKNLLKYITVAAIALMPLAAIAQSSCDALFREGQRLQQTMTVSAQNKAINHFAKARECYDSAERKEICNQQIRTCQAIIQRLAPAKRRSVEETDTTTPRSRATAKPANYNRADIDLRVEKGRESLEFKAKNPDPEEVAINCNYTDWEVASKPDWINVFPNSEHNAILITAETNDTDEARSGEITIICGDKSVIIAVSQKKPSWAERLRRKVLKK